MACSLSLTGRFCLTKNHKCIMKQATIILACLCLFSCKKDEGGGSADDGYKGYIYTSNNATSGNGIIMMGRKSDGTLAELPGSPMATGSAGDAADGDFDHQNGLRIIGDYLLAVNAGANPVNGTISVFKINRTNGSLAQVDQNSSTPVMDNMDSHGERPVSIAAKMIGGTAYIAVGNQHSNPHYEMTPPMAKGMVTTSSNRNLAVFTMDMGTGVLQFKNIGATYPEGTYGGPSNVDFNESGSKIAVSTWGVAHIMTNDADLTLQKPSRLFTYDFNGGNLTQTGMYEEAGVSGSIGFSWSPNQQYIYLSNFNLHSSKEDKSVTVHNAGNAAMMQNFATGAARNDEACWTWVSNDKSKLFVVSFSSNEVSVFDIGADGRLAKSLNPNYFARQGGIPMADSKDLYQASDGYLYVSGAFKTHSVAAFRVGGNGALTELPASPYRVPSSAGKTDMEHAFIGLTGFDK